MVAPPEGTPGSMGCISIGNSPLKTLAAYRRDLLYEAPDEHPARPPPDSP